VRRRHLVVFGIWLPLLIIVVGVSGAVGTNFRTDFTLPDFEDPATFASAVADCDAVISCVGARRRSDAGVAADVTRAIVTAMLGTGVRRIAVVSPTSAPRSPVGT